MKKACRHHFWNTLVDRRSLGFGSALGDQDLVARNLYLSLQPSWETLRRSQHGGIFNLSFSPDGSILVAATEGKSILLFDPLCHRLVQKVENAHGDCVNYARFLDSRTFATCSDDTTVALWDIRYLQRKIRSLLGHSNWVKNIEYASDVGLLVTSGFDGSIYTWNINEFSESGAEFQRIFHTNKLMRMRLTPDSRKMVICTTGGYIMVIHDLDLHNLSHDLQGFKPNMYDPVMLLGANPDPGCVHNHAYATKRNRVELITDFPRGNDAEVISSLQVHPQGWCVLSRNTSSDENSEWTCVHDIQEPPLDTLRCVQDTPESADLRPLRPLVQFWLHPPQDHHPLFPIREHIDDDDEIPETRVLHVSGGSRHENPTVTEGTIEEATAFLAGRASLSAHVSARPRRPRLLHYAREPNVGRGWIKELCFSTDGRLVCSPHAYGVRLLAFNSQCRELSDCLPQSPQPLVQLLTNVSHANFVVSTKFSPTHCLLASGCLNGKVCFHQPVL
ncbi:DDB1- and CUL4-associated factor 10-like isoform X2 [Ornithodoros turicata]